MIRQRFLTKSALRFFIVVCLCIFLTIWFALSLRPCHGFFGYQTDGDGVVINVNDNSPAARAGIEIGDRVDESTTPPLYRWNVVVLTFVWDPGQHVTFGLIHKNVRRTITLTAVCNPNSPGRMFIKIMQFVVGIIYIFLGAALVLLRPSLITWGFYFTCLYFNPGDWSIGSLMFPFPGVWILSTASALILAAGEVGLLIFALGFLNDPARGWRLAALRLSPWLFAVLAIVSVWGLYQTAWFGGPPGELLNRTVLVTIPTLFAILALGIFIATYAQAQGSDRQRIRWVIVGFAASQGFNVLSNLIVFYLPSVAYWQVLAVLGMSLVLPVSIAYAVIKHHVIDVNFVISRALVLAILTSFVVIIFALIDWIFVRKLERTGLGIIADILAVTGLGFAARAMHRKVDAIVERTLFRRRHAAEKRLLTLAGELPEAQSLQELSKGLTLEPLNAFGLTSAALFQRVDDNRFERKDAIGWPPEALQNLDVELAPLSDLAALRETKRIQWTDPSHIEFPAPDGHPVLAMPILVRRKLQAIVFYGVHNNGADFDPDEIRDINALMIPAAAAYDHLEAEALRRENERIRLEMEQLAAAKEVEIESSDTTFRQPPGS